LETAYEDISITSEFKIDNDLSEFSETVNESKTHIIYQDSFCKKKKIVFIGINETEKSCNYMKVEQGEEAVEREMDVISLSSSTLSDFDVITEEEINLLK